MKKKILFFAVLFISGIVMSQRSVSKRYDFSHPDMISLMLEPDRSPLVKTISLSNKLTMEYAEQGYASGVPVIFLHGLSDTWRSYELALPFLSHDIHAYMLTLRGHGNTGKPTGQYTADDFAGDVFLFMKQLKIESAIIVGHSLGSVVAQNFAVKYPEKTLGLVLVGSFYSFKSNPEMQGFRDMVNALTEPIDPAFVEAFQKGTIVKDVPKDFVDIVIEDAKKLPVHAWKSIVNGLFESDIEKSLPTLQKPAMVIWGDKDVIAPAGDQEKLKIAIPDCRLIRYEGVGHATHWEEPAKFAEDINDFVMSIREKSVHSFL